MEEVEFAILLDVLQIVLERFQNTSVQLKKSGLSLNTTVQLLQSLLKLVEALRSQFDHFEEKGKAKCGITGSTICKKDTKRMRKRKSFNYEIGTVEVNLTGRQKFRVTVFLPIID